MPQPEIQLFGAHEVAVLEDELAVESAALITATELLQGLVGLIQLLKRREPRLVTNHRYVDACAWLDARAEGVHVHKT